MNERTIEMRKAEEKDEERHTGEEARTDNRKVHGREALSCIVEGRGNDSVPLKTLSLLFIIRDRAPPSPP